MLRADEMWCSLLESFDERGCILNAEEFPWIITGGKYQAKATDQIVRYETKFGMKRGDIVPYNDYTANRNNRVPSGHQYRDNNKDHFAPKSGSLPINKK